MSWSKEHTANFIEIYRGNECIWKVKSKNYHNNGKREAAYKKLLDYVHTFEPSATKDTLLKKINNLRSTFRKEQKKVIRSLKAATGRRADNIYLPKWSHYSQLKFLLEKDKESLEESSCLDNDAEDETRAKATRGGAEAAQSADRSPRIPPITPHNRRPVMW
ncbi:hypothetical protein J6590_026678 [Homalodisca vitripennis]|nr:hypothetical protein J6590_026678 [Homalodisca vitripennis]